MPETEGVIREALPGNEGENGVVDPLAWTESEVSAMDGSADEETPYERGRLKKEARDGVPAEQPESEEVAAAPGGEGSEEDPSAFLDTRERKESYTPQEWEQLVKQRDYFQRRDSELTSEISTVTQRVEQLSELMMQEPQEQVEIPEKEVDPAGYLEHKIEAVTDKLDGMTQSQQEEQQQRDMATAQQNFVAASANATHAYLEKSKLSQEDFDKRIAAVREERFNDFVEEGYSQDDSFRLLVGWENTLITASFQRGENPAEVLDRRYRRRSTVPSQVQNEQQSSVDTGGPSAEEVITRAQAGVKMQKGDAGIQRGSSFTVTYDLLAKASKEEFNEIMDQIQGTSKEDELDLTGSTRLVLK